MLYLNIYKLANLGNENIYKTKGFDIKLFKIHSFFFSKRWIGRMEHRRFIRSVRNFDNGITRALSTSGNVE